MNETHREDNIRLLGELLEDFPVAMLTTILTRDGSLHSRPMMTQNAVFDGNLWFFSKFDSAKVDEIRAGSQVNLAYTASAEGRFISVAGSANIIHERLQMEALWNDSYQTWFPAGLDEPGLALLRIEVNAAEVWDSASGANGLVLRFV